MGAVQWVPLAKRSARGPSRIPPWPVTIGAITTAKRPPEPRDQTSNRESGPNTAWSSGPGPRVSRRESARFDLRLAVRRCSSVFAG